MTADTECQGRWVLELDEQLDGPDHVVVHRCTDCGERVVDVARGSSMQFVGYVHRWDCRDARHAAEIALRRNPPTKVK